MRKKLRCGCGGLFKSNWVATNLITNVNILKLIDRVWAMLCSKCGHVTFTKRQALAASRKILIKRKKRPNNRFKN